MSSLNPQHSLPTTPADLPELNRAGVEAGADTSDSSGGRARWYKLPTAIASDPELRPASKIVWAVLADRQGDNGHCWPSVRRIAQDAGLTVGAAHRAVIELERAGRLTIDRTRRPNTYLVLEIERMFQGRNVGHVPSTEQDVPRTEPRCSTGGIKPDPITRSKNQNKKAPRKTAEPDHRTQEAVGIWMDSYREARGQAADRLDGRTIGRLAPWLVKNGVDVQTWRARIRLAAGLDGRVPPWPFYENREPKAGELTIDNVMKHWAKLGDALRGSNHGCDGRVRTTAGTYAHATIREL